MTDFLPLWKQLMQSLWGNIGLYQTCNIVWSALQCQAGAFCREGTEQIERARESRYTSKHVQEPTQGSTARRIGSAAWIFISKLLPLLQRGLLFYREGEDSICFPKRRYVRPKLYDFLSQKTLILVPTGWGPCYTNVYIVDACSLFVSVIACLVSKTCRWHFDYKKLAMALKQFGMRKLNSVSLWQTGRER